MSALTWEDGRPRSRGNAFDILYEAPRPVHKVSQPPKKRGPKRKRTVREKVLASLRGNKGSAFNTPIMTRAESDRTLAIAGRGFA